MECDENMVATNFRTEKLLKELTDLFKKRLDNFDDLKYFALDGEEKDVKFCYGKAAGYRRSIYDLLIAFDLTDTELYRRNDDHFELKYLVEREKELAELNE